MTLFDCHGKKWPLNSHKFPGKRDKSLWDISSYSRFYHVLNAPKKSDLCWLDSNDKGTKHPKNDTFSWILWELAIFEGFYCKYRETKTEKTKNSENKVTPIRDCFGIVILWRNYLVVIIVIITVEIMDAFVDLFDKKYKYSKKRQKI